MLVGKSFQLVDVRKVRCRSLAPQDAVSSMRGAPSDVCEVDVPVATIRHDSSRDSTLITTRSRNQGKRQQRRVEDAVAVFDIMSSPIRLDSNLGAIARVAGSPRIAARRSMGKSTPMAVARD